MLKLCINKEQSVKYIKDINMKFENIALSNIIDDLEYDYGMSSPNEIY